MNLNKIFKEWGWTIFILFVISGIGLGIRLYNLTILPVFVDEAIYVRWSQVMAIEPTLRFLPLSDGKQPLFMWVLMFLIKYFSDPLFVGRLISVGTGMGTILGVFTLSYLLFKNKKTAVVATLLYTVSPFSVFFDRMALVDSMLSMFGIWTAVFGYLTAKHKRWDLAMLTGFMLGFAFLTKSPAIFVGLLLPSFWWLTGLRGIWKLGATYVIAFAMYNVQRLGPNFDMLSSRTGDYVRPLNHIFINFFDPLIPHLKDVAVWLSSFGPSAIIPVVLIGAYLGFKQNFKTTILLLGWLLVPIFIQSELALAFTARYIYFTIPYLFILAGLVVVTDQKWLRYIGYGLITVFLVQSSIFNFYLLTNPEKANLSRGERSGYLEEWTAGQGIKEISEYLKNESSLIDNQQIIVGTEGYFGTLPDGLQIYVNDHPNIVVIGVGVIITETPKSLKEAVEAGNKTYLVVNKSRFRADYEELGYKFIAKYPKGLRLTDSDQYAKYGPQEELLFFEIVK
ncbi:MAG: glycosyltransferase family 39 protein [bacterium]|nr:MAG: glycosyltransferase family 39 protein [bacterium]